MIKKDFKNITIIGVLAFFIFTLLFLPSISLASTENPASNNEENPAEFTGTGDDTWEYTIEDRDDPFLPFVKPNVVTTTATVPEEEVILTGMQLFEPGQLRLVGIIFTPGKKLAMVEDVTGKGYVIDEGTLIGRYGIVSQITLDQVNITETRKVAGKEVTSPVVMRLDKEGDQ